MRTSRVFAQTVTYESKGSEMRVMEKVYICLFTCAATRGIHLELTKGLDVDSFLLTLQRFSAQRGLPATLVSDNAKTFRAASKEVRKIARSEEVLHHLTENRISWKFIVEKAPWWGGFWERMVQSVKRSLWKAIGSANLSFEELRTLLIEVESVINARPLTYVQDDSEGVNYALTPSHLMYGRKIVNFPNSSHYEIESTYQTLTKRMKNHKHLLNQLLRTWRRDYLINLRESHLFKVRQKKESLIAI